MELFLLIMALLIAAAGLAFTILPVIPGTILSYGALLLIHFSGAQNQFSPAFLIVTGIISAIVLWVDFFVPAFGVKRMGGSKMAALGSLIGGILGMFFGPVGIIIGPFVGALIGELIVSNDRNKALSSALGAFIGFVVATASKVVVGCFVFFMAIRALFIYIF